MPLGRNLLVGAFGSADNSPFCPNSGQARLGQSFIRVHSWLTPLHCPITKFEASLESLIERLLLKSLGLISTRLEKQMPHISRSVSTYDLTRTKSLILQGFLILRID